MWTLYHWSYDEILLRCLSHKEAHKALKEAHDGTCGVHQLGPKLENQLRRLGYYWPKMIPDAIPMLSDAACQIHSNFIHQEPRHLHPIYSRDLYCCKFALEDSKTSRGDLQVKEIFKASTSLELKDWWFSYIDFILYGILPDDHKEAAPSEGKLIGSILKWSREHCIIGRTMESYSDAFHTNRNRRRLKKLMMVHVELTNDLNSETSLEDMATIGRRRSLMSSPMLSDAMPVDPWWLCLSSTRTSLSNVLFMAILNMGNGCYRTH